MIISTDSDFCKDVISLEVSIEQLRALVKYRDLTKKEIVELLRRIQSKADSMERKTKAAGKAYFN